MPTAVADRVFAPSEAWVIRIGEQRDSFPGMTSQDGTFYRVSFERRSEMIGADGTIVWSEKLAHVDVEDI